MLQTLKSLVKLMISGFVFFPRIDSGKKHGAELNEVKLIHKFRTCLLSRSISFLRKASTLMYC